MSEIRVYGVGSADWCDGPCKYKTLSAERDAALAQVAELRRLMDEALGRPAEAIEALKSPCTDDIE